MRKWEKARHEGLGGTDMAAVMGLDPYDSKYDTFLEKTQLYKKKWQDGNKYTVWGKRKEPIIADHYAEENRVRLVNSGGDNVADDFGAGRRSHPIVPWWFGTPDRLLVADERDELERPEFIVTDPVTGLRILKRGLEIKTGLAKHKPRWGKDGSAVRSFSEAEPLVPLYYYVQCCCYMEIMGFSEWDLVVLLDSSDYRHFRIFRDPGFVARMEAECGQFWNEHVLPRKAPKLDHGNLLGAYLATVYPKPSTTVRTASPEEEALIRRLGHLQDKIKTSVEQVTDTAVEIDQLTDILAVQKDELTGLEKEESALKNELRSLIGSDLGIRTAGGYELLWRRSEKAHSLRLSQK